MKSIEKALERFMDWDGVVGKSDRTIENRMYEVTRFARDMKLTRLDQITEYTINDWINAKESPTSVGTRRFKLSCIKSFVSFCLAKGWMDGNPAQLVKVNIRNVKHAKREAEKKKAFDEAEYKFVYNNIKDPEFLGELPEEIGDFWLAATVIGVETGLRFGDIVQLEWDCLTSTTITVWTDKRDKRVSLKMSSLLRRVIMGIKQTNKTYLFPEQRREYLGKSRHKYPMQYKRILKRMGINDKTFHSTRVTFATRASKAGGKLAQIAKDLGHSSVKTTQDHYIAA